MSDQAWDMMLARRLPRRAASVPYKIPSTAITVTGFPTLIRVHQSKDQPLTDHCGNDAAADREQLALQVSAKDQLLAKARSQRKRDPGGSLGYGPRQ